jgi:hypothetical protein
MTTPAAPVRAAVRMDGYGGCEDLQGFAKAGRACSREDVVHVRGPRRGAAPQGVQQSRLQIPVRHLGAGTGSLFGHHVVSEDANPRDLDFDDIARDHVAVGPLRAHPDHVAWMEGGVPAQLLNPGCGIPDLVG